MFLGQAWSSCYHRRFSTFDSHILSIPLCSLRLESLFLFELLEFSKHIRILKDLVCPLDQPLLQGLDAVGQLRFVHVLSLHLGIICLWVSLRRGRFLTRIFLLLWYLYNLLDILGLVFTISIQNLLLDRLLKHVEIIQGELPDTGKIHVAIEECIDLLRYPMTSEGVFLAVFHLILVDVRYIWLFIWTVVIIVILLRIN